MLQRKPRFEKGFTLVMFVMIIAVMSIMMGAAVQAVSFQMRREREAELIFRGEQYVEAIRLYKMRYGRNPMRLKEIWEADPKVIRKKWKDPITDSENWGIIFVGQEGRNLGGNTGPNGTPGAETPLPTGTPGTGMGGRGRSGSGRGNDGLPPGVTRNEEGELVGPIVGVRSTSCDDSIRVYKGRTRYCEWEFVYKQQRQPGQRGGGARGGGPFGGGGRGRGGRPGDNSNTDRTPLPYPTGTPHP